jgi:hypothetical protein
MTEISSLKPENNNALAVQDSNIQLQESMRSGKSGCMGGQRGGGVFLAKQTPVVAKEGLVRPSNYSVRSLDCGES